MRITGTFLASLQEYEGSYIFLHFIPPEAFTGKIPIQLFISTNSQRYNPNIKWYEGTVLPKSRYHQR